MPQTTIHARTDPEQVSPERAPRPVEELAFRERDGITVTLLWRREADEARVVVIDDARGHLFELVVGPHDSPLDMFHHPYAYVRDDQMRPLPAVHWAPDNPLNG